MYISHKIRLNRSSAVIAIFIQLVVFRVSADSKGSLGMLQLCIEREPDGTAVLETSWGRDAFVLTKADSMWLIDLKDLVDAILIPAKRRESVFGPSNALKTVDVFPNFPTTGYRRVVSFTGLDASHPLQNNILVFQQHQMIRYKAQIVKSLPGLERQAVEKPSESTPTSNSSQTDTTSPRSTFGSTTTPKFTIIPTPKPTPEFTTNSTPETTPRSTPESTPESPPEFTPEPQTESTPGPKPKLDEARINATLVGVHTTDFWPYYPKHMPVQLKTIYTIRGSRILVLIGSYNDRPPKALYLLNKNNLDSPVSEIDLSGSGKSIMTDGYFIPYQSKAMFHHILSNERLKRGTMRLTVLRGGDICVDETCAPLREFMSCDELIRVYTNGLAYWIQYETEMTLRLLMAALIAGLSISFSVSVTFIFTQLSKVLALT